MLGALIGAAGSLIGSAIGSKSQSDTNKANLELAKYQNEWNRQMQDRAFKYNYEMWNKQNEYNSPTAQMARMKAAGLNPNLMYGKGDTGNASSAPTMKAAQGIAPRMQAFTGWNLGLSEGVQTYMQMRMNNAVINKTQADAAKTAAETANVIASKKGVGARSEMDLLNLRRAQQLYDNSIETANATLDNIRSSTRANNVRTELARADLSMKPQQLEKLQNEIIGVKNENDLKSFELTLQQKYGLSRNSPEWMKIVAIALRGLVGDFGFGDATGALRRGVEKIFKP